jgi:hypothetical protein
MSAFVPFVFCVDGDLAIGRSPIRGVLTDFINGLFFQNLIFGLDQATGTACVV